MDSPVGALVDSLVAPVVLAILLFTCSFKPREGEKKRYEVLSCSAMPGSIAAVPA